MKSIMFSILIVNLFFACAQPVKPVENSNPTTAATVQELNSEIQLDTNWTEKVIKSKDEWKKILTPDQFYITREQGTERAFSSELYENHEKGIFFCVCCQNPLFSSATKFNSGTGWPSFYAALSTKSVSVSKDDSHGMSRDEVSCQRCDAHLGHVFDDGPKPTGLRYCMDGVALKFQKEIAKPALSKATFAAGCFWCEEAVFESVTGVSEVISGYAGGEKKNPTYEEVGQGSTGHAESVEVYYDANKVSYMSLLKVFFASGDLTQVNGQGPDNGSQYRSVIFYRNDSEKQAAEQFIDQLNQSKKLSAPVSVQLLPYTVFWKAEEYHQNYVKNHPENPYVQHESLPRLKRAKEQITELLKK